MAERGAGQPSWPLSPYDLNVRYGKPGAAGLGPDWFGPLEPITPLAPPEVAGRQWDYLSGYNLSTTARSNAPISFATLRGLADGYDLLRLVIETRKDQVARLNWTIASRDKKSSTDPRIANLKRFFSKPDGRHGFADWLRLLLEDLFVIDAPTLYLSRDRAGRLLGLLPIDGATIKPVIDDWGRTPLPYAENGETIYPAAYQQILKGYPAVDYSVRDLIYRPRNIRVDRAYGSAPASHMSGARFTRLDNAIFKYALPSIYINSGFYLKFQSFNVFGQSAQPLADCSAYSYTPVGSSWLGAVAQALASGANVDCGIASGAASEYDDFGLASDPYPYFIDLGSASS